uniref:Uncharacterized protein n=1 Tax=Nelumbo nucifera TaxID=4432 RepID=A0A822ZDJ6_NELNU|nr:TPA_asm: hypothetical protein HUJ06_001423 [Nelumbo nucifera]
MTSNDSLYLVSDDLDRFTLCGVNNHNRSPYYKALDLLPNLIPCIPSSLRVGSLVPSFLLAQGL